MAAMPHSSGVRTTNCRPSLSCGQKPWLDGGARVSCTFSPRRMATEPSSISAFNSSAIGAPTALINAPARPGPTTSAPELASAFFECASTRRSRPTTWVSTICEAEPATTCTEPSTNPTAYSQGMPNQPIHQAKGTLTSTRASMASPAT